MCIDRQGGVLSAFIVRTIEIPYGTLKAKMYSVAHCVQVIKVCETVFEAIISGFFKLHTVMWLPLLNMSKMNNGKV